MDYHIAHNAHIIAYLMHIADDLVRLRAAVDRLWE